MFCPKCGNQIPDGAAFCGGCGAVIPVRQVGSSHVSASIQASAPMSSPMDTTESIGESEIEDSTQQSVVFETGESSVISEKDPGLELLSETPVDSSTDALAHDEEKDEEDPKQKKNIKVPLIITAVVVVIVCIAVAVGFIMHQQKVEEEEKAAAQLASAQKAALDSIDDAYLKELLSKQSSFMKGAASNDFVKESPYEVTEVSISNKELKSDGKKAQVEAKVTIDNEFFSEAASLTVDFDYDQDASTYKFKELTTDSVDITPLRGIAYDTSRGFADLTASDAQLNSDHDQCTVTKDSDVKQYWFGETGTRITYTYKFEKNKWVFSNEANTSGLLNIDKIIGKYTDPRGGKTYDHGYFTNFVIKPYSAKTADDGKTVQVKMDFQWQPDGRNEDRFAGYPGADGTLTLQQDGERLKIVKAETANVRVDLTNFTGYFDKEGVVLTGKWRVEATKAGKSSWIDLTNYDIRLVRAS